MFLHVYRICIVFYSSLKNLRPSLLVANILHPAAICAYNTGVLFVQHSKYTDNTINSNELSQNRLVYVSISIIYLYNTIFTVISFSVKMPYILQKLKDSL